jgi:hypothetical protein
MLAQIAYSAAFGGKTEDKVQKQSEQSGGHKVYDGVDNTVVSAPSLNVQSLDEGINQLEGVERFQDTPEQ